MVFVFAVLLCNGQYITCRPGNIYSHCRKCHKVVHLPIPEEQLKALALSCPDVKVENYFLTVFGLCSDCARQEQ